MPGHLLYARVIGKHPVIINRTLFRSALLPYRDFRTYVLTPECFIGVFRSENYLLLLVERF